MKVEAAAIMDGPPTGVPAPAASAVPAAQPGELFAALLDQAAAAACAPFVGAPLQADAAGEPAAGDDTTQAPAECGTPVAIFPCLPFSPIIPGAPGDRADCTLSSESPPGEPSEASAARALRAQDPEQLPPGVRSAEQAGPVAPESAIIGRDGGPGRLPVTAPSDLPGKPTTGEPASAPVTDAKSAQEPARAPRTLPEDRPVPGGDQAPQCARVCAEEPEHGVAMYPAASGPEAALSGEPREGAKIAPDPMVLPVLSPIPAAPTPFAGRNAVEPIRPPASGENPSDTSAAQAEKQRREGGTVFRAAAAKAPPFFKRLAGPDVAALSRESGEIRPPEASPEILYEARSGSAGSQGPAESTAQHAAKIAESEWIPHLSPHPASDAAPATALPASRWQPAILAPGFAGESASAATATALAGAGRPPLHTQVEIAFSEIDFLPRLAEQVHLRLRDGSNVIRIQLRPGGLGRMEIRAECSGPSMSAAILTESSWARTYVEQNLAVLYQNLQDLGLKVDRLVVLEDAWARHPSAQQGDPGSRPQDEDGREFYPRSWPEPEGNPPENPASSVSSTYILRSLYSTFHAVA